MNFLRLLSFFSLAVAMLLSSSVHAVETLVGSLPGDFSVDNRGSSNYIVPLQVPPGINGLQPNLSLSYNSNAGNGDVGVGWGLSTGFPQAITRGRTLLARDGIVKGVTFMASDKFYLDGKLLVLTSGTYGSAGSTYRTEVDSFATVIATGSGTTINTFTVVTKNGLTLTFGKLGTATDGFQTLQGASSTIVSPQAYRYALKQVQDAYGNSITYTYSNQGNSEYLLTAITYGSASSSMSVSLAYEAKTDTRKNYIGGYSYCSSKRLKSVIGKTGTTEAIRYTLNYTYGGKSLQSRLNSVYASFPGSTQTASTTFEYTPDNTIIPILDNTGIWPGSGNYDATISPSSYSVMGDFNRDGRDEFQRVDGINYPVFQSSGTFELIKQGDFDGDGVPDKMLITVNVPNVVADGRTIGGYVRASITLSDTGNQVILSYLGKTDLTAYFYDKPTNTSGTTNYTNNLAYEGEGISTRIVIGDFTGDGRDDVMIHSMKGNLYLHKSNGSGFDTPNPSNPAAENIGGEGTVTDMSQWVPSNGSYLWIPYFKIKRNGRLTPTVADLNGDGVADYVFIRSMEGEGISTITAGSGTAYDYRMDQFVVAILSNGDGTFSAPTYLGEIGYMCSSSDYFDFRRISQGYQVGDFNGDGLSDILLHSSLMASGNYETQPWWHLYLSKGESSNGAYSYQDVTGSLPNYIDVSGVKVPTRYRAFTVNELSGYSTGRIYQSYLLRSLVANLEASNGFPNAFIADMNDDGLSDYVWYVRLDKNDNVFAQQGWYVMYSKGEFTNQGHGFSDPVKLSNFNIGNPQGLTSSKGIEHYIVSKGADFNGDGYGDFIVNYSNSTHYLSGSAAYPGHSRKVYYATPDGNPSHDVVRPDLLKAVTDGLGRRTEIEYKAAKDSDVYTKGAAVTYPIREVFGSNPVVSDVYKDFGGTFWTDTDGDGVHDAGEPYKDAYHISYQYSGNRTDLSGRGNLGFHSFVTLDHQTKLFKYQFLTQSFPMTGLVKREQTYRATPTYGSDGSVTGCTLLPISSQDNDVVFDEVRNGPGGALWGTVYPFMSHSSELRWEDNTATLITVTKTNPESLFAQYNSAYTANKAKAHSNIESYVWFDEQPLTSTPVTALPSAFNESTVPGAQDAVPVGFTTWGTSTSGALKSFNLPRKISYGNITRTKLNYSDGYTTDTRTGYATPLSTNGNRTDLPLWNQVSAVTPTLSQNGLITRYTYNNKGWVVSKTLDTGNSTVTSPSPSLTTTQTYSYNSRGQLEKTVVSDNTTGLDYDLKENITLSQITAWDASGRFPTTVVDHYGHPSISEYDAFGRVTRVRDVNGENTTTVYDGLGRPTVVTDVLRSLSTATAIKVTSGSGVTGPQTVALPVTAVYTSAHSGNQGLLLTSKYYTRVVESGKPPVTTHYDRTGRPIRVIREGFSGQVTYTDTIYNLDGEVIAVSNPYLSTTAAASIPWTVNVYDALGRLSKVAAPNGTVTTTTYKGRVSQVSVKATDRTAQTTTTLVNVKGETVKVWNADNVPATTTQVSASGSPSVEFVPDGFGRMVQTKTWQGGTAYATITSGYDPLGNQISLNDPDKGAWSYTYDALGRLRYQRDAVGNITRFSYDPLGRQLTRSITEAGSSPVETTNWYYYDTAANSSRANVVVEPKTQWIGAVQRETVSTSWAGHTADRLRNYSMQTAYYYNRLGQMYLDLHQLDGKYFYRHLTYDAFGRPEHVNYFWRPAGLESTVNTKPYMWQSYGYTNAYDGEGYLTKVSDSLGKTWWQSNGAAAYDYLDRPVNFIKGGTSDTRTWRGFDPKTGLLTAIQTGTNGSSSYAVQNLTFAYDGLGNLKSRVDATTGRNLTETFTYDVLNRLTQSAVGSSARNYAYATNGNLSSKTDINGSSSAYAYHSTKKHAVTAAFGYSMGYDANGNITSAAKGSETWAFNWSGFDKPRWMSDTGKGNAFLYGADHMRRVHLNFNAFSGNTATGAPTHYTEKKLYVANGEMEVDYKNASTSGESWSLDTVRVYIPGSDGRAGAAELKPTATAASQHRFLVYHYDHLGSIQTITNWGTATLSTESDSSRKSLFSYEPWGMNRNPISWLGDASNQSTYSAGNGTDSTPRGFTGHEMMEGPFVHMNGRIYNPTLGVFFSADPIVQSPANLQSYNRYSYCMNNPLTYVDPSGYYSILGFEFADGGGAIGFMRDVSGYAHVAIGGARSGAVGYGKGLVIGTANLVEDTAHVVRHPVETFQGTADGLGTFVGMAVYEPDVLVSNLSKTVNEIANDPEKIGELSANIVVGAFLDAGAAKALQKLDHLSVSTHVDNTPNSALSNRLQSVETGSVSSDYRPHVNAAIAEARGWQAALDNGHLPIKQPGKVTAPGVDFITYDPKSGNIILWDAKYRGPNGTFPTGKPSGPKIKNWAQEARDAIEGMPESENKKMFWDAFENGNIDTEYYKWPEE